jgi:hypothetical protein
METTNTNRNRATGRYTDSKLMKGCVCGHALGNHDAERDGDYQPCQHAGCACDAFKKAAR